MPLDVSYVFAKQAIEKLEKILSNIPHGERDEISDDIINMVEDIVKKHKL